MRLPRVRFTVRRMMVMVAISESVMAPAAWLAPRADRFHNRAIEHLRLMHESVRDASGRDASGYHAVVCLKYRAAASYPWLPVAPDPPEPK
jgi:hypothetical protein